MYSHSWVPFLSFSSIILFSFGMNTSERSFNCTSQDFSSTRISTRNSSIHQNRIIGGDSSPLSDYVGVIALKNEDDSYRFCTAVKIAPTYLITTASCASNPLFQYAFLNVSSFFKPEGEINIKSKSWDPRYQSGIVDQQKHYDLAIIELESSSPDTSKYMRISVNASLPAQGTYVRMAGYGTAGINESTTGKDLKQVDVPVYPEDECQERYAEKDIRLDFEDQVCSGYSDRTCGICLGDFGGPMFQYDDDGEPVLVGINIRYASVGCTGDTPTIAVRTAQYLSNFTEIGLREGIELTRTVRELRVTPSPSPSSPSSPFPSDSSSPNSSLTNSLSPDASETSSSISIKSSSNVGLIVGIVVGVLFTIIILIIIIILFVRRQKSKDNFLQDYIKPKVPEQDPQAGLNSQYSPTSEEAIMRLPDNFPSQPNSRASIPTEIQPKPDPIP